MYKRTRNDNKRVHAGYTYCLYIPKNFIESFVEIEKIAKERNRGVGYILCELYEKSKEELK